MVHPAVHVPFDENFLYGAEAHLGRSGTKVTVSGGPLEFPFESEDGIIGRHFTASVYTPRLTHDNDAFQDATFTASIVDGFAQLAMSSGASGEDGADDPQTGGPQFDENVGEAAHYLQYVNKQWACIW